MNDKTFKTWLVWREFATAGLPQKDVSRRTLFRFLTSVREAYPVLVRERTTRNIVVGKHGNFVREKGPPAFEYHYFCLPLESIVEYENRCTVVKAGTDIGAARRGGGVIETAEGGKLYALIRRLHLLHPDWSANTIRQICIDTFGEEISAGQLIFGTQRRLAMPPERTFQHVLKVHRERISA